MICQVNNCSNVDCPYFQEDLDAVERFPKHDGQAVDQGRRTTCPSCQFPVWWSISSSLDVDGQEHLYIKGMIDEEQVAKEFFR